MARRLFHRGVRASLVAARGLLPSCGAWALECVSRWDLSSLIRDPTCAPYIGRWNLDHWTTREVPTTWFYFPRNTFWPSSCVSTYWSTLFIIRDYTKFQIQWYHSTLAPDAGKDWGQEEKKEGTEDEMVGWHHQFNGHKFEQIQGDSEGQGSRACCSSRGNKESGTT